MHKTARFDIDPNITWIKANVNQSGFYRVMYEEHMWYSLIALLKKNHTIISAADRANLIDDAFTLCRYLLNLFFYKRTLTEGETF